LRLAAIAADPRVQPVPALPVRHGTGPGRRDPAESLGLRCGIDITPWNITI
jgi:hypothetical protein